MKRIVVAFVAVTAMVASACGASGGSAKGGSEQEGSTTTAATGGSSESAFGDLAKVCGEGNFKIKADEAGKGTDKLYLAVANDRSAQIKPGLNKVLYDASVAFAGWCNENGGVGGLPIEIVDMDAGLFNVEPAMTTACKDAFAMVGGGLVQDSLEFSGKEGSDFHKCGMIDIPGFAVSPEKTDSNGQVQPIPNPATSMGTGYFSAFKKLFPEETKSWGIFNADLPSLDPQTRKYIAAAKAVDVPMAGKVSFPPIGITDFTPYVQKFLELKSPSFTFVGEVEMLTGVLAGLNQQKWNGRPLVETNMYDQKLLAEAGAEGTVIRMTYHPLEEADKWPGTKKYLDINEKYNKGGEISGLGIQSTSAWLLFVTAANACGEKNGGELTRDCILKEAAAVEKWTGGGLHGEQNPEPAKTAKASPCSMLLEVKGGKFERLFPKLDSSDDDGEGFSCPADSVIEVPENAGLGKVDPDRPI